MEKIVGYLVTHPIAFVIFIVVCLALAAVGGGKSTGRSSNSGLDELGGGSGKSPGSDLFD